MWLLDAPVAGKHVDDQQPSAVCVGGLRRAHRLRAGCAIGRFDSDLVRADGDGEIKSTVGMADTVGRQL
jgi:hypothetical protein